VAEFLEIPIELHVSGDAKIFQLAERHVPEPEHMAWADEDREKVFTRGVEIAQVVVGVKKNRPR
jgi:hypothetical protein